MHIHNESQMFILLEKREAAAEIGVWEKNVVTSNAMFEEVKKWKMYE